MRRERWIAGRGWGAAGGAARRLQRAEGGLVEDLVVRVVLGAEAADPGRARLAALASLCHRGLEVVAEEDVVGWVLAIELVLLLGLEVDDDGVVQRDERGVGAVRRERLGEAALDDLVLPVERGLELGPLRRGEGGERLGGGVRHRHLRETEAETKTCARRERFGNRDCNGAAMGTVSMCGKELAVTVMAPALNVSCAWLRAFLLNASERLPKPLRPSLMASICKSVALRASNRLCFASAPFSLHCSSVVSPRSKSFLHVSRPASAALRPASAALRLAAASYNVRANGARERRVLTACEPNMGLDGPRV